MDRRRVSVGTAAELDREQREHWARAALEEKLRAITYLRECFYGPEATTGRVQRTVTIIRPNESTSGIVPAL
jgi:hypothetical protein